MNADSNSSVERLRRPRDNPLNRLLETRSANGLWTGRLSSSPLATAVSIVALHTADAHHCVVCIKKGLDWLAAHQNPDGGWGDTENRDPSNLSTTLLALAAFCAIDKQHRFADATSNAHTWLKTKLHYTTDTDLIDSVYNAYGSDLTFAVPILTLCTLAGLFNNVSNPWRYVKPLPFELARLPRSFYRMLNLTVVSYALPALIAVGQVKFHFDPPKNPLLRAIRRKACIPTLELLTTLQPVNGGFLEAPPLTAFVTMSLAAIGQTNHPVTQKGLEFLIASMRPDGSWPIDTNLSTWLTTHAVKALTANPDAEYLSVDQRHTITKALLKQQHKTVHPFTGAAPGGWSWSDLPGAVPDADDTAGVLVALHRLGIDCDNVRRATCSGLTWLLDLQNSDGGIPTFCRGWGKLEFDRSCPDITAHALEAFTFWQDQLPLPLAARIRHAISRLLTYLYAQQRTDGTWLPLWFGNPSATDKTNPVYGTARVLSVLSKLDFGRYPILEVMIPPAIIFLASSQHSDGGWSAGTDIPSSIEETALAVTALKHAGPQNAEAVNAGVNFLIQATSEGTHFPPAPIGLYFAKLWYTEDLYPLIFALEALNTPNTHHRRHDCKNTGYSGPCDR